MLFLLPLLSCTAPSPDQDSKKQQDDSGSVDSMDSVGGGLEVDITGHAYAMDLSTVPIEAPPNLGSIVGSQLTAPLLLGVTSASRRELSLLFASANEDGTSQDTCVATTSVPTTDFRNSPDLEVGPVDLQVPLSGLRLPLLGATFTGTFALDGSSIGDGTLEGTIDVRIVADALPDLGYDAEGLCTLLAGFGGSCTPCSTDQQPFCTPFRAVNIQADQVAVSLMEVERNDCQGCTRGAPVCF